MLLHDKADRKLPSVLADVSVQCTGRSFIIAVSEKPHILPEQWQGIKHVGGEITSSVHNHSYLEGLEKQPTAYGCVCTWSVPPFMWPKTLPAWNATGYTTDLHHQSGNGWSVSKKDPILMSHLWESRLTFHGFTLRIEIFELVNDEHSWWYTRVVKNQVPKGWQYLECRSVSTSCCPDPSELIFSLVYFHVWRSGLFSYSLQMFS